MSTFSANTDRLAKCAPPFYTLSSRLDQAREQLQSKLDEVGNCWGDDSTGKTFSNNYLTPVFKVRSGLTKLVELLQSTGEGIETMAKGIQRNEDAVTDVAKHGADAPAPGPSNSGPSNSGPSAPAAPHQASDPTRAAPTHAATQTPSPAQTPTVGGSDKATEPPNGLFAEVQHVVKPNPAQ